MRMIIMCLVCILVICLHLVCFPNPTRAAILWSGDVIPADPGTWTSSTDAYLGYSVGANGTLNITSDSDVVDMFGYIASGDGSTGNVTVDGAGSTWTNSHNLYLGYGVEADGTLNITSDSDVVDMFVYIASGDGSTGNVTVDGAGSTWTNSHNLYLGYGVGADGTLNITDGGLVSNSFGYIASGDGSTGNVTVDGAGSTWTNSYNLYVGYEGSGILNITDGGLVSVVGTLTIDYDSDGDGFVGMGSGGMLALQGEADDSLGSFLGLIDGTDAIFYWDDSALNWANISGADDGVDYTLSYLTEGDMAGYTILTVDALIPVFMDGDANNDGLVSADDYAAVQGNFGNAGLAGILGDANVDGLVSADDFAIVQANFGATAGLGSATVPEPATLSLLMIGGLAMLRKTRRE